MVELRDEDEGRVALVMDKEELPFAVEALLRVGYELTPPSEIDGEGPEEDEQAEGEEEEPEDEPEEPEAAAEEPEDEPEDEAEEEPEEEPEKPRARSRKSRSR